MIGTTLSHYRITAKLGEGGMGEVYRAHDERLDRGVASRVTFDPGIDANPVFSPDGRSVFFNSNRSGPSFGIWVMRDDGSGVAEEVLVSDQSVISVDLSSDGQHLLCTMVSEGTSRDIWALPMHGSGELFPVVQSEYHDGQPFFSPDGRWIVYSSAESGRNEIYARPFPGPGRKWQVSTDGGSEPQWSPDGREIFYTDTAERLMSVSVETAPEFRLGVPEMLFQTSLSPVVARRRYTATSDGQRFLMVSRLEGQAEPPISVVMNWPALLEQ